MPNLPTSLVTKGNKIMSNNLKLPILESRGSYGKQSPVDFAQSKADLLKDNSLDTIGLKELRSLDAKIGNE